MNHDDETTEMAAARAGPRRAERVEHDPGRVSAGMWRWVKKNPEPAADNEPAEWLGCITHVGSNYVKIESPQGDTLRIHLDALDDETRPEPNVTAVLAERVAASKAEVGRLLAAVKAVTARLGVAPTPTASESNYALARIAGETDIKAYEAALEKAKKDELPALFAQMKRENERLAEWMSAEVLPLRATAERAKEAVEFVEDRIFNVSLYAGLTEAVVQFAKGEPAPASEKLHVFQTRLYMDEESLLGYAHGGLEFKEIKAFDKWMAKKENRDRLLPFPRTLIAMRVRRHEARRTADSLETAWLNFELAELDKLTFIYMRNGDRLYRMNCDLEFGPLIFPARDEFLAEPSMANIKGDVNAGDARAVSFITVREYEARIAADVEKKKRSDAWFKANPIRAWSRAERARIEEDYETALAKARAVRDAAVAEARADAERAPSDIRRSEERAEKDLASAIERAKWERTHELGRDMKYRWRNANPARWDDSHDIRRQGWEPFDKSSVYYDECLKDIHAQVKHWNRIALIIQGLFDRSEVFHPHPPVSSWTPAGFASAIELVYDGTNALEPGPPPDFEAYRQAGLASLGPRSVTIGQSRVWLHREREREYERRHRDWRLDMKARELGSWWSPSWDSGPGYVARIATWCPGDRAATYRWMRGRRNGSWRSEEQRVRDSISVPAADLFNVSAYRPGDYLRFFQDRRTRQQYLRWAPLLLTAEEYYARNVEAQEPGKDPPKRSRADRDVAFSESRKPDDDGDDDTDYGDDEEG